jgi:SsrA-binding protein
MNTPNQPKTIAQNKKARFDYDILEHFEAGVQLEGWEVKSLREGKVQLVDSYILLKSQEAFLIGTLITPLPTASTHIKPDPTRTRKLLLHRRELDKLAGAVKQKGYAIVPVSLYWKANRVKADIALVVGKKQHDKRESLRERDWQREKQRVMKTKLR